MNSLKFDFDLGKNFVMKRPFLKRIFVRTKNGCFLCSLLNSWMRMKSCVMTGFLVKYSVEMTCTMRRIYSRTMTCTMRRIRKKRMTNAMVCCIVTYFLKRMCF